MNIMDMVSILSYVTEVLFLPLLIPISDWWHFIHLNTQPQILKSWKVRGKYL